jgi:hypothetical protein
MDAGSEHELQLNGHKFKFAWRDVIQLAMIVSAIIGIYVTVTGRIDSNTRAINEIRAQVDQGEKSRVAMDANGTRRSHEIDATQQQTIDYHTKQLEEIYRRLQDLGPTVDKINANVLWLMGKQLEGQKR